MATYINSREKVYSGTPPQIHPQRPPTPYGDGRGARIGGVVWASGYWRSGLGVELLYNVNVPGEPAECYNKNVYLIADVSSGSGLGVWFGR